MTGEEKIKSLRKALECFAAMDRPGDHVNLDEPACVRGIASDLTMITSRDFRRASEVLKETEDPSEKEKKGSGIPKHGDIEERGFDPGIYEAESRFKGRSTKTE